MRRATCTRPSSLTIQRPTACGGSAGAAGWTRLPGSEGDAVARRARIRRPGDLYVSDAEEGSLWRFPPLGRGARWLRHPLLAPGALGIGANGVAFVPPATLYVAVTEQNHIVRIPIRTGGRPGTASVAAAGDPLQIIDSLAADVHGDLYAAIVGFTIVGTSPVVRVDLRTGALPPVTGELRPVRLAHQPRVRPGAARPQEPVRGELGDLPGEGRPDAAPGGPGGGRDGGGTRPLGSPADKPLVWLHGGGEDASLLVWGAC